MAYTNAIDPASPAVTDLVSMGDDEIRTLKAAIIERLETLVVDFDADPLVMKAAASYAAITAPQVSYASGIATPITNGATFDITIPTRRPVRLEIASNANPAAVRTYYVGSDGSATAVVSSLLDMTSGGLSAAGQTTSSVRVTNNTGVTVSIAWALSAALPTGL